MKLQQVKKISGKAVKTDYYVRFRDTQDKCEYANLNTKGFCKHNFWDNGLCHCNKKEFDGRKVRIYLCCPHLIMNDY